MTAALIFSFFSNDDDDGDNFGWFTLSKKYLLSFTDVKEIMKKRGAIKFARMTKPLKTFHHSQWFLRLK